MIIKNDIRHPISNLDLLPYPSRDIHEKISQKYLYISGSRGCLGGCSFWRNIYKERNFPPYVRLRSAESVVNEMEYLIKSIM